MEDSHNDCQRGLSDKVTDNAEIAMWEIEPVNEVTLLPVTPGSLTSEDKAILREAGVIVVEHENPSELRLLRPCAELSASDMLMAAMKALVTSDTDYSRGTLQRQSFTKFLADAMIKRHDG